MTIDTITAEDLAALTSHRHPASVSLYVPSSWAGSQTSRPPIGHDTEAARTKLKSGTDAALGELETVGISHADRTAIADAVERLGRDRDFWSTHARSIAVFASPEGLRAFRLRNELPRHSATGDRYDVGPLVRATTFSHRGYALAHTVGEVRFLALDSNDTVSAVDLDIPDDAADALEHTTTGGRFDRHRAAGTLGPKVGQRNYSSTVQDAVLKAIGDDTAPLVLAAASDLAPAYREVNTYKALLDTGVDANPASLSDEELASRARALLEEHYRSKIEEWNEEFGTLRAHGRASSQWSDIARAATAGLVDTLVFDFENTLEGTIDEAGSITIADEPGPATYGLADEIAARVLRTGGTVRAVRRGDLPDENPIAATFRGTAA